MTAYLISFVAALGATLVLTPIARALATHYKILDCPDAGRKLQKVPVPLLGGVAVFGGWWLGLAITAAAGLTLRLPAAMPQAALTLAALSLVGICDDAWNMRARWKLLGQVVAALPIALSGCGLGQVACFGWTIDCGIWGPGLTVLWLILGINALNLIDGMDGMASLTGLCICLTAAALDMQSGGSHVAMFALGLGGSLAGFLIFNYPPAKIYLGDAGSMVIGLAVSLVSMRVARTPNGVTHLTPMFALMALPLADTGLAILRRSLSGRGIWHADRGHIHHRLVERGLSAREILALVAVFLLLWGGIIVAAATKPAEALVWLVAAVLAAGAVRWRLAGHCEWAMLTDLVLKRIRPAAVLPTLVELESLSFASAWQRLRSIVAAYPLDRLTVSVWQVNGAEHEHIWHDETDEAGAGVGVAVEVLRSSRGSGGCRVRVESAQPRIARGWPRLLATLERFADHWAAHPESAAVSRLRLHDADEPTVGDRSPAAERIQRRRAA